jgi:hypothetical protein
MPSPFSASLAAMETRLDDHIGERIVITPLANGDFGRAVDGSRPVIDVIGLADFIDPSSADIAKLNARVPYEELEAEIRRELLPAGWKVHKDDAVALPERPWTEYKVGRVDHSDPARLRITLCKIGTD